MIRSTRILVSFCITMGLLVPFFFALAHQPRLIGAPVASIPVSHPDISQAFYGKLRGAPDSYTVTANAPLHLYVSVLVPDSITSKKDIFVIGTDQETTSILFTINGTTGTWERFYEPFGGDWYLQGPSAELDVPAGTYNLTVSSGLNADKYVLVIGKTEQFSIMDAAHAFILIPRIKLFYFEKSLLQTLCSPWGIFASGVLLLFVLFLLLLIHFFRAHKLRKHFIIFLSMIYYKYIERSGNTFSYIYMKFTHYIAFALLVIGGLNWLLVGLFSWDVGMLFGGQAAIISRIIYVLVGISAVIIAVTHKSDCKTCSSTM